MRDRYSGDFLKSDNHNFNKSMFPALSLCHCYTLFTLRVSVGLFSCRNFFFVLCPFRIQKRFKKIRPKIANITPFPYNTV